MGEGDDFEGEPISLTCSHCDGTGRDKYSDGVMDCEHCQGEGYEWWD